MKTVLNSVLDPNRRSNDAREFDGALRRKIVGQDQAIEKVVEIYQMFLAGLNPPGRPVPTLPRNRQADRVAPGLPRAPRDSSAADAGSSEPVAHGQAEALDPAV